MTAFPADSLKPTIPGANLGTKLFGVGFLAEAVDFFNPLSDIQDIIDLF